jgi:NADH:ubiquinone oxidoreductase subunit 2 (subunit N)
MSAPGLAAFALGLGLVALLVRHRPTIPWLAGVIGFGLLFVACWILPAGEVATIGGETFVTTGYLRLFLALLAICGAALTLVAWAAALTRALPGLTLVWFAAAASALAATSPVPAILILTGGSIVPVLAGVPAGAAHDVVVLGRGVRAVVVSGVLALLALPAASLAVAGLAILGSDAASATGSDLAAGGLGLALLATAAALALRSGAVPLHGWQGRLSEALDAPAIPIIFAWGPAAFAIVLLAWSGQALNVPGQPLVLERLVVNAVAIASLILGAMAALLHDDLEHVVGYSLVSDAGILLLALTAQPEAGWAASRTWILAYVVTKSAFAGWATATELAYGTRRISDLGGWARRSPLLAGALLVIGVTAVGLPGLTAFEARSELIDLALDSPLDVLARLGIVASAAYFLRLLVTGFSPASSAVALATDLWPAWPGAAARVVSVGAVRQVPAAVRRNRRPASAAGILAVALLGLAVAAGAFRGSALAALPGPVPSTPPGGTSGPFSSRPPSAPGALPGGSPGQLPDAATPTPSPAVVGSPPAGGSPAVGATPPALATSPAGATPPAASGPTGAPLPTPVAPPQSSATPPG